MSQIQPNFKRERGREKWRHAGGRPSGHRRRRVSPPGGSSCQDISNGGWRVGSRALCGSHAPDHCATVIAPIPLRFFDPRVERPIKSKPLTSTTSLSTQKFVLTARFSEKRTKPNCCGSRESRHLRSEFRRHQRVREVVGSRNMCPEC